MFRRGDTGYQTAKGLNDTIKRIAKSEVKALIGSKGSTSAPLIRIENKSATDLVVGDALAITGAYLEESYYTLEGDVISSSTENDLIVFVAEDIPADGVGTFNISGDIKHDVSITSGTDKYARPVATSHQFETCSYPTRFRVIDTDATEGSMMIVSPAKFVANQLRFVAWKTVDGKRVLQCETLDGTTDTDISVAPATGVNETSWDNKTISGITYTKIDENERDADDGTTNVSEFLTPIYYDEVICVLPNDEDTDPSNPLPYREAGSNKVWAKEC